MGPHGETSRVGSGKVLVSVTGLGTPDLEALVVAVKV